jgi:2-keto-3-deoxy-L-rhamnonate aldolase RhmA
LKHQLNQSNKPIKGVVTGQYRDTDHVEILGLLGYDFLWIDCEHSSGSPDHVLNLLVAAERRGLPAIVRIGYGYQNIIGYVYLHCCCVDVFGEYIDDEF